MPQTFSYPRFTVSLPDGWTASPSGSGAVFDDADRLDQFVVTCLEPGVALSESQRVAAVAELWRVRRDDLVESTEGRAMILPAHVNLAGERPTLRYVGQDALHGVLLFGEILATATGLYALAYYRHHPEAEPIEFVVTAQQVCAAVALRG